MMKKEQIPGEQVVLKLLEAWVVKAKMTVSSAAEIANGVIAVILSNGDYVIMFNTITYEGTQEAIAASGGIDKVMLAEWVANKRNLGCLWTAFKHAPVDFGKFRLECVSTLLVCKNKKPISWLLNPVPIPWDHVEVTADLPATARIESPLTRAMDQAMAPDGIDPDLLAKLEELDLPGIQAIEDQSGNLPIADRCPDS